MTVQTNVVVIGGGYAGVLAANRLRQRDDIHVTLVNPRPQFVERIRLHQLIIGTNDAVADFDALLAEGVQLVVDIAVAIDPEQRQVRLASGSTLGYDYLVYAVGSTGAVPAAVPGARENAYPLAELEAAQKLAARLADVPLTNPIVVVGAGLTGIEAAAEFAEAGRSVTVVSDKLGPSLAEGGRRAVAKRLAKLGVTVLQGVRVASVARDSVTLSDGSVLSSAATVWTAGFGVPGLAAESGLPTDTLGRLLTDETLTSVGYRSIVAAGDASSPSGVPFRMSCQFGIPLASYAADTILARLDDREPKVINPASLGQSISLGRGAGIVQMAHFDDTNIPMYVAGKVAASIKEMVCKGTLTNLQKEARKPGSFSWVNGGKRQQRLAAAERDSAPSSS
jgi:NADH:ubiquinone reductase (H+-translocating)